MASWPRTVPVKRAAAPIMPGAALSIGLGGSQTRNVADIGWGWVEEYANFSVATAAGRAFLARIARAWNEGEVFTIVHPDLKAPAPGAYGANGSTPKVDGANQCGTSLATKGWPSSQTVLKEGDPISVAGLAGVRRLRADAVSDNAGKVVLQLSPLIIVGSSPADEALITWTAVAFNCFLAEEPDMRSYLSDEASRVAGLQLTFLETLG